MTAKIIDFAQKQREKREREFLDTDVSGLSPEELRNLSISLRAHLIESAHQRGDMVYKNDGYTTIMFNNMAWSIPDVPPEDSVEEE